MRILAQPSYINNTIVFSPRSSAGFANNARALRGLIVFCLVYNKPLRGKIIILLYFVVFWNNYYQVMGSCLKPLQVKKSNDFVNL